MLSMLCLSVNYIFLCQYLLTFSLLQISSCYWYWVRDRLHFNHMVCLIVLIRFLSGLAKQVKISEKGVDVICVMLWMLKGKSISDSGLFLCQRSIWSRLVALTTLTPLFEKIRFLWVLSFHNIKMLGWNQSTYSTKSIHSCRLPLRNMAVPQVFTENAYQTAFWQETCHQI